MTATATAMVKRIWQSYFVANGPADGADTGPDVEAPKATEARAREGSGHALLPAACAC
jgi:hypothetical protein